MASINAIRFKSLALTLLVGVSSNLLQASQAAIIETGANLTDEPLPEETSTTSPPYPWPTDTTYIWASENECITTAPDGAPGNCLISITARSTDPGYVKNWCGRKTWTTTETKTLTVDCGGCDQLQVSKQRGGCPHGLPPPKTVTPEVLPYYVYEYECATTLEPSLPTIPACVPRE